MISADAIEPGDFQLVTPLGTVSTSAVADQTLGDGGVAYFLGVISNGSGDFTTASIQPGSGVPSASYFFVLDDVTVATVAAVPEPGSLVHLASLLASYALVRIWRLRRPSPNGTAP